MNNRIIILLFLAFSWLLLGFISQGLDMKPQVLLSGRMEILLPLDFEPTDTAILNARFSKRERPQESYNNAGMDAILSLNIGQMEKEQTKYSVGEMVDTVVGITTNLMKEVTILDYGTVTQHGTSFGFIESTINRNPGHTYMFQYYAKVDSDIIIVLFACYDCDIEKWRITAKEIMGSLKVN